MGPVSGTGRAMMASLQQAIQKGMPPDQAIQYVKSMATQGVAPMTDLYAMVNQFQRLKQQQVKPPQTPPTIRDQLNMMDQQQRMQGGIAGMQAPAPQGNPMDRGLGAIDAGRMEYPQFAGGGVVALAQGGDFDDDVVRMANGTPPSIFERLGEAFGAQSLAAPVNPMGREISLAGISLEEIAPQYEKALLEGNQERIAALGAALNRTERGRDLELGIRNKVAEQRRTREAAERKAGALGFVRGETKPAATGTAGAGAGTARTGGVGTVGASAGVPTSIGGVDAIFKREREALEGQANKTLEQQLAETEALEAKMGIGKAAEERGKYLDRREAEAAKQMSEDRRMALAQAGFAMAEAASRRGRERTGFLGAAAIGGTRGAQLIDKAVRENRALKDSIAENRFALAQANEMRKAGNIKEAKALESQAKANLRALSMAEAQSKQSLAELGIRESGQDRRTAMQVAAERERYQAAAEVQRQRLMQGILEEAPMLIPGFEKLSPEEKAKSLQSLLTSLAGGTSKMTGTIEGVEE